MFAHTRLNWNRKLYNYSLAPPSPLGLTLRGKEPRGDRKAWLPDKEGGLLSTWLHTSPKSPPSWISIWPLSGQNAMFAGEPRSCAPHSLTRLFLSSGPVGSSLEISRAPVVLWLSEVFAHLWKWGGENYSAKSSSICNHSGDQMKRRCFQELQISALASVASGGCMGGCCIQPQFLCPLSWTFLSLGRFSLCYLLRLRLLLS